MDALVYSVKQCKYIHSYQHTQAFICQNIEVKNEISFYFERVNELLNISAPNLAPFINISKSDLCLLVYNLGAFAPHVQVKINASALNMILAEIEYALVIDPKILSQLLSGLSYLKLNISGKLDSKAISNILVMLENSRTSLGPIRTLYALAQLAEAELLDKHQNQIDINPLLQAIAQNASTSDDFYKALSYSTIFATKTKMVTKISPDSLNSIVRGFYNMNHNVLANLKFLKNLAQLALANHLEGPISSDDISSLLYGILCNYNQSVPVENGYKNSANAVYCVGEIANSGILSGPIAHDVIVLVFQIISLSTCYPSHLDLMLCGIFLLARNQRLFFPIDNAVVESVLDCAISTKCPLNLKASMLFSLGVLSESGYLLTYPNPTKMRHLLCLLHSPYTTEKEICFIISGLGRLARHNHLALTLDMNLMTYLLNLLIQREPECDSILSTFKGLLNIYQFHSIATMSLSRQVSALVNIFNKNTPCAQKKNEMFSTLEGLYQYHLIDQSVLNVMSKGDTPSLIEASKSSPDMRFHQPLLFIGTTLSSCSSDEPTNTEGLFSELSHLSVSDNASSQKIRP